jgi:hypothetical protein
MLRHWFKHDASDREFMETKFSGDRAAKCAINRKKLGNSG